MAANQQLYREKSLERISSPEQLNDYLKVTRPAVWAVLAAIILLLVGALIWGSFAYIGSTVTGGAEVRNGQMTIQFDDDEFAGNVQAGMTVSAGETTSTIKNVGYGRDGKIFAQADTTLSDGDYEVQVTYKKTQVLDLLFNK